MRSKFNVWFTFALLAFVAAFLAAAGAQEAEQADPGPATEEIERVDPPTSSVPLPDDNEVAWSGWLASQLGGEAEHRLFSGRRVDVLTGDLAIEVEWCKASKINEAIAQARYYSTATGRPGAVILLVGRGEPAIERVTFDRLVQEAMRYGLRSVAIIDVRAPDVANCCNHLGVPTIAK